MNDTQPMILALGTVHPAGRRILEPRCRIVELGTLLPRDVPDELADAVGVIVRGDGGFTGQQIAAAPKLRVIGRTGAGLDNVDLQAAAAAGVTVVYAPAMNVSAVAEMTVGMFLMLGRGVPHLNTELRRGNWAARNGSLGNELRGATVGIVGLGKIGREVARLCNAFGARLQAYDPYFTPPGDQASSSAPVALVELDELFASSDYISLHAPLTPETAGLLSRDRLQQVKPGAVVVNVARGGLAPDLDALYEALESDRLAGLALDVFPTEPPSEHHPIFDHSRCIVTPHVAGMSRQSSEAVFRSIANDMLAVLGGREPRYPVNSPTTTRPA